MIDRKKLVEEYAKRLREASTPRKGRAVAFNNALKLLVALAGGPEAKCVVGERAPLDPREGRVRPVPHGGVPMVCPLCRRQTWVEVQGGAVVLAFHDNRPPLRSVCRGSRKSVEGAKVMLAEVVLDALAENEATNWCPNVFIVDSTLARDQSVEELWAAQDWLDYVAEGGELDEAGKHRACPRWLAELLGPVGGPATERSEPGGPEEAPQRCPARDGYGDGPAQCELEAGHSGGHSCAKAVAAYEKARRGRS